MSPEQILTAMAEMYANCSSYRDTGRVSTRWLRVEGPNHTSVRPFETGFVRPDRFRFEFRDRFTEEDSWHRYLVWSCGADVRTWWELRPGVEEQESLALALAGATGISSGSAHTIPRLLMPDQITGWCLTQLVEVVSLGDAALRNVTCYRLQGWHRIPPMTPAEADWFREETFRVTGQRMNPPQPQDLLLTLWIDRGTFLIRRIEKHSRFETDERSGIRTHTIEGITEYEPKVEVTVTDEELRFDPSRAGR